MPPQVHPGEEQSEGREGERPPEEHVDLQKRPALTTQQTMANMTLQGKLAEIAETMCTQAESKLWHAKSFNPLGVKRNLIQAVVMTAFAYAVVVYGLIKFTILLRHDVFGGKRCANCGLRPLRDSIVAVTFAGFFFVASLGVSEFIIRSTGLKWRWHVLSEKFGRLQRLQCCVSYEVYQLVISLVAIANWNYGMKLLAQIDMPGDKMHMLYVIGGHKHRTRAYPADEHNPLGINTDGATLFYRIELVVLYSVVLQSIFASAARIFSPLCLERNRFWLQWQVIEVGVVVGVAYPRIFESLGYTGSLVNGYSPFVFCGVFRLARCCRLVRLMDLLYSKTGISSKVNGVLVRYYVLCAKVLCFLLVSAVLICFFEYPCLINARRHKNGLMRDGCNAWFKHFDMCIYFIVVTFSTVGYGDMYPATREGRAWMAVLVLVFVLQLPGVIACIRELSDGDDVSDDEKVQMVVGCLWKDVALLTHNFEDLAQSLDAIAGLAQNSKLPQDQTLMIRYLDDVRTRQADLLVHVQSIGQSELRTQQELASINAALNLIKAKSHDHQLHEPPPTLLKSHFLSPMVKQQFSEPLMQPVYQPPSPRLVVHQHPLPFPQHFSETPVYTYDSASRPPEHNYSTASEIQAPRPLFYYPHRGGSGGEEEPRHKSSSRRRKKEKPSSSGPWRKHKLHRSSRRHASDDEGINDLPPSRPAQGYYTDLPDSRPLYTTS